MRFQLSFLFSGQLSSKTIEVQILASVILVCLWKNPLFDRTSVHPLLLRHLKGVRSHGLQPNCIRELSGNVQYYVQSFREVN